MFKKECTYLRLSFKRQPTVPVNERRAPVTAWQYPSYLAGSFIRQPPNFVDPVNYQVSVKPKPNVYSMLSTAYAA